MELNVGEKESLEVKVRSSVLDVTENKEDHWPSGAEPLRVNLSQPGQPSMVYIAHPASVSLLDLQMANPSEVAHTCSVDSQLSLSCMHCMLLYNKLMPSCVGI